MSGEVIVDVFQQSFLRNGAYRGPTYVEALDAARALSGSGAEEGRAARASHPGEER
jgi:hypothetical protein